MRRAAMGCVVLAATVALLMGSALSASASAGKGMLFHDGDVVRTVVVSAPVPNGGTDPFFSVTNPAPGQLGIAGVAPGDAGYSGGDWAVFTVTFNPGVTPYLLTSDEAVAAAEAAGDVTVVRTPGDDFRCPVQP
ncbi:MAG TPA: hypothetical protein VKA30_05080 [Actinomycetota bacterium]|nr:hypothetical protein [Actinomycetota bacterium]